ncbi:hypothetical protein SISNIDRAFT_516777 [Sistotremastrum niveocremeum HHB9708]|uniref:Uncharacterized protein n=1 Tax=Sistotremastrum niveocremeum HHB9708 TaxID=1314777 RepID=A0A164SFQ6_9AGAM|nr:hypothetical protein SISNIDRAFT_516777 [Sistotremastrum niveocremeum HHB9708]
MNRGSATQPVQVPDLPVADTEPQSSLSEASSEASHHTEDTTDAHSFNVNLQSPEMINSTEGRLWTVQFDIQLSRQPSDYHFLWIVLKITPHEMLTKSESQNEAPAPTPSPRPGITFLTPGPPRALKLIDSWSGKRVAAFLFKKDRDTLDDPQPPDPLSIPCELRTVAGFFCSIAGSFCNPLPLMPDVLPFMENVPAWITSGVWAERSSNLDKAYTCLFPQTLDLGTVAARVDVSYGDMPESDEDPHYGRQPITWGPGHLLDFTPWGCLTNAPIEERQFSLVIQTVEYCETPVSAPSNLRHYAIHIDVVRNPGLEYIEAELNFDLVSTSHRQTSISLENPSDDLAQAIHVSEAFSNRRLWIRGELKSPYYQVNSRKYGGSGHHPQTKVSVTLTKTISKTMPIIIPLLINVQTGDSFSMSVAGKIKTIEHRSTSSSDFGFEIKWVPCLSFGWKRPPVPPGQRVSVFEMKEEKPNRCVIG